MRNHGLGIVICSLAAGALLFGCNSVQQPTNASSSRVTCGGNDDCRTSSAGSLCDVGAGNCVVCLDDGQCSAGQHCDRKSNACVTCLTDSNCPSGDVCVGGNCQKGCDSGTACSNGLLCIAGACVQCGIDADCVAAKLGTHCDATSHQCLACVSDADCGAGAFCRNNKCHPGCTSSQDCATGMVCDTTVGACVECVGDGDCKQAGKGVCDIHSNACVACTVGNDVCPPGQYCAGTSCAAGCRNDKDCTGANKECLVPHHTCVQCLADGDCAQGQICQGNACVTGCNHDSDCGAGTSCCGGACVPVDTTTNCGSCGNACASGAGCCGGSCTNLGSTSNCGGCGVVCASGDSCCGSGCSNLLTDAANCGACGNACAAGQVCCSGACKDPNAPSPCLDCTKACNSDLVAGTQFSSAGSLDNLIDDNNGLSTGHGGPKTQYVWVAMHDSNIVNKVGIDGSLLGTFPTGGGNPSRGAMALDGSFWIAHRCPSDPNNPNCSNVSHINVDGSIACQAKYAADGNVLPFCRALAIDARGYVWVGTFNDGRVHKIDPDTCKVVQDVQLPGGSRPYGFAIDPKGTMYVTTIGTGPWAAIDTATGHATAIDNHGYTTYGVTVDKAGNVYFGHWCGNGILRMDGSTHDVSYLAGSLPGFCSRWVAVDTDGNIWAAFWNGGSPSYASKFAGGSGSWLGTYAFHALGSGVAIDGDAYGTLWFTGQTSNNVVRFSKDIQQNDQTISVTPLKGSNPYNYSDITGYSLRTITTTDGQIGNWGGRFDGGNPHATWDSATWAASTPAAQATLRARFRAAPTAGQLSSASWCGPFTSSPADLTSCSFAPGAQQWLEIDVRLTTNNAFEPTQLNDLTVYWQN